MTSIMEINEIHLTVVSEGLWNLHGFILFFILQIQPCFHLEWNNMLCIQDTDIIFYRSSVQKEMIVVII